MGEGDGAGACDYAYDCKWFLIASAVKLAAYGVNASGEEDAFLLVPLPEPGAIGVVGMGIAMGMLRRRRFGESCPPR